MTDLDDDGSRFGHFQPASPLISYWEKFSLKWENCAKQDKQQDKVKEHNKLIGTKCGICAETVTLMKCEGCHY